MGSTPVLPPKKIAWEGDTHPDILTDGHGNSMKESAKGRFFENPASKAKLAQKLTFFAWRFYTLYEQKFSNLRPLLSITFPQGFRKYRQFGHWTLESGGKTRLNGVNKW